jgi:acetyl esterase/lipase
MEDMGTGGRSVQENRIREGVPYAEIDGQALLLNIAWPVATGDTPGAAVIYVHGGGWHMGDRGDSPNYLLTDAGFVTLSIDYRLTGAASFPAQIHDVKAAIRWTRTNAADLGIDPDRIGIWGHSAGGHLALLAAVTGDEPSLEGDVGVTGVDEKVSSAVSAVIAGCTRTEMLIDWYAADGKPFPEPVDASLCALLGGPRHERENIARQASPYWHLKPGMPPTLLMHGTDDETVPISQARAFVSRSRAMGNTVELMELHGVGHDANAPLFPGVPDHHGSKSRVVDFFDTHLRGHLPE